MRLAPRFRSVGSSRHAARGQALAELAIVLPVAFLLFAVTLDLARAYGAWTALEGATRNAAEAAVRAGDARSADAAAQTALCSEMVGIEGFVGRGTSCTSPSLSITWRSGPTPTGEQGSLVRATVATEFRFPTVVPWPAVTAGGTLLLSSRIELERLHR